VGSIKFIFLLMLFYRTHLKIKNPNSQKSLGFFITLIRLKIAGNEYFVTFTPHKKNFK